MKKVLQLVFVLMFGSMFTNAQQHFCGTSLVTQHNGLERLTDNRNRAGDQWGQSAGQRDIIYVPIKFHIVGNNDGVGYVTENSVFELLCTLNEDFLDQDVQFYMDLPFNYIDNNTLNTDAQSNGGVFQITSNKVQNAMNIFIVSSFPQSGLQGYYQGPPLTNDFIVIRKSAVFGNTVSHEVGHFFSLAHPFYGWEGNPWNAQDHGMTVGNHAPSDPSEIGNVGLILNEKMDQSNCTVASDRICDTPSDYLFAFSAGQNGCNSWNGGTMDPNGDECDPMEVNMMSYFGSCGDYEFTADQKAAIQEDLATPQRNYVTPGITPNLSEVVGTTTLNYPINGESTPGYNAVIFEWDAVENAANYFLEIDIFPTFTNNPKRFIVAGSTKMIEGIFNANTTYYWRVRPFSSYSTCNNALSTSGQFVTGSVVAVTEIADVNDWTVRPNPISSGTVLNVQIDAANAFDATINLYSTTGQLVSTSTAQEFASGLTTVDINTANLTPGLYIVAIQTETGVMNKKVVVTK